MLLESRKLNVYHLLQPYSDNVCDGDLLAKAKQLLLTLIMMKGLSIQKMLSMPLDMKDGRIYPEGS